MKKEMIKRVSMIRRFNRYYTNILGLLDQYVLDSDLSLAEVRVLHEIEKTKECTSSMLSEILCIDTGYLSRILKKLYKLELIIKEKSTKDGRAQFLFLTSKGKDKMNELNLGSNKQIIELIKTLSENDQKQIVQNMTSIETILTQGSQVKLEDIIIRTELLAGDIGFITYLHAWIYKEEYGYSELFEGYVAESLCKFIRDYNPSKDRLWCAQHNGNIIGCIGIIDRGECAQLRWFLIDPHYRSLGLGKKLLQEALTFAKEKEYKRIYLLTCNDLDTAIGMYERVGFVKKAEEAHKLWREDLMELTFELQL